MFTSTVYGIRTGSTTPFMVHVFTGADAPQRASRLANNLTSYSKVGQYGLSYWTTTENH
jgi:hypothetical protein